MLPQNPYSDRCYTKFKQKTARLQPSSLAHFCRYPFCFMLPSNLNFSLRCSIFFPKGSGLTASTDDRLFCKAPFRRLLIESSAPDGPQHHAKKRFFFNAALDAFSQCSDSPLFFAERSKSLYRLEETPKRLLSLLADRCTRTFASRDWRCDCWNLRIFTKKFITFRNTKMCFSSPTALEILCSNCFTFKKMFSRCNFLNLSLRHSLLHSII